MMPEKGGFARERARCNGNRKKRCENNRKNNLLRGITSGRGEGKKASVDNT